MIETTKGIILSNLRYSETSLILKVFTYDYGKISIIAKGALGNKNKYGASIQPLSFSDIQFYKKNAGLNLLSKSEFIDYFSKISSNFTSMSFAMGIIEAINLTQEENAHNTEVFDLIVESLKLINSGAEPITVYFIFLNKLCENMGFALNLDVDIEKAWYYFSLTDGQVIKDSFFGKKFVKLSSNQLILLKKFQLAEPSNISNIRVYENDKKSLNNFFSEYLSFHLEKNFYINSIDLII